MDILNKELKMKFHYMGREQREAVAEWLLSDNEDHLDRLDDIDRIQGVLHEEGYELTYHQIQLIWRNLSRVHDSEWLELPKYDKTILTTFETQGDLHEYER